MEEKLEITLDQEWVVLIKEAKDLGLSKEQLKEYFMEKAAERQ